MYVLITDVKPDRIKNTDFGLHGYAQYSNDDRLVDTME